MCTIQVLIRISVPHQGNCYGKAYAEHSAREHCRRAGSKGVIILNLWVKVRSEENNKSKASKPKREWLYCGTIVNRHTTQGGQSTSRGADVDR